MEVSCEMLVAWKTFTLYQAFYYPWIFPLGFRAAPCPCPQAPESTAEFHMPLLTLAWYTRRRVLPLMGKDRTHQCLDGTELREIQRDTLCLWRPLENRGGGHLLGLSLCFKCGCLNLNWMYLGIFYKESHLEGCRFLLSVMFYYWEEGRPEELQSSGTGKNKRVK